MRLRTLGPGMLVIIALLYSALLHGPAMAVEYPLESETRGWQPPRVAQGPLRDNQVGFRALYSVNRDGTNAKLFAAAPGMISSATPEWSHDGRYVAFDALPEFDAITESQIFVVAVDGPFKGKVLDLGFGNTPSWSPDDRQLAFMINPGNPIGVLEGIWIMTTDGNHRERVANGFYPRWSPDGKRLCVHAWREDGRPSLILIDAQTHQPRSLLWQADWSLDQYGGNWTADGKQIVFVGTHDGQDHLASIAVDDVENPIRILYTNPDPTQELIGPPAVSRDGKQIVFAKQPKLQQGPRQWWKSYLYSMPADASSAPKLLEEKEVGNINRGMSFSPDSSTVLFSSER